MLDESDSAESTSSEGRQNFEIVQVVFLDLPSLASLFLLLRSLIIMDYKARLGISNLLTFRLVDLVNPFFLHSLLLRRLS
jgi:hypothetical protein